MGKLTYFYSMATIKFLTKGKSDPQTIYIRLRDGRKIDFSYSTGLTISPKNWSNTTNWIIQRADFHNKRNLEKNLIELESLILGERNERISKGLPINREWFESLLLNWQGKANDGASDILTAEIMRYKDELPNRIRNGKKGVAQGTLRNYNTTVTRLRKFEAAQKKQFRIIEVDLSFHANYLKYASNVLGLAPYSIGRDIKHIKTVCLNARENGIEINEQIRSKNFYAPSDKTLFTTLNISELELIKQFKGSDYLENARDWLIIGCWTGCRVGDLMSLTKKNVVFTKEGRKKIQYTQSKTGKLVNVPMHKDVEEILERLGDFPRPISSVKFNDYIKKVCQRSGLTYMEHGTLQNPQTHRKETGKFEKWQLIKSHTCRRSFATNHYSKMPNKVIMMVTGHATEKMLLAYIGETEVEHMDDFFDLWDSEKQNEKLMVKGA